MVDVDVAGGGPGRAVVRALPASACGSTCRVGYDPGAIALEDRLARVAGPRLCDPVRKEIAAVAGLWALSGYGEAGKLSSCFTGGRDVGWCASN